MTNRKSAKREEDLKQELARMDEDRKRDEERKLKEEKLKEMAAKSKTTSMQAPLYYSMGYLTHINFSFCSWPTQASLRVVYTNSQLNQC